MSDELSPTVEESATDVGRLNQLFDEITEKRYLSPTVFTQAVRGALNLFGVLLPLLPIETDALDEGEYVFHIDTLDMYLYMVADCNDDGLYECYAQVVDEDELDDITNDDLLARTFPELVGDINGETEYQKQVRHAGVIDSD